MWNEKILTAKENFADAFSLPKDMVVNATLVHIIGKHDIYIENYIGLISYTNKCIEVKGHSNKVCVTGDCLAIEYFGEDDMKIKGRICEIKLL